MAVIRRYEEADGAQVRALFIRVNRALAPDGLRERFDAYVAFALRTEIDRIPAYYAAPSSFWVAVAVSAVIGTVGLEAVGDGAFELRRMYVDVGHRRRGLGSALLAHAEATCRRDGARKLILSTSELQSAAIALYEAAGFKLRRQVVATELSHKTIGGGIRRFEYDKDIGGGRGQPM